MTCGGAWGSYRDNAWEGVEGAPAASSMASTSVVAIVLGGT